MGALHRVLSAVRDAAMVQVDVTDRAWSDEREATLTVSTTMGDLRELGRALYALDCGAEVRLRQE